VKNLNSSVTIDRFVEGVSTLRARSTDEKRHYVYIKTNRPRSPYTGVSSTTCTIASFNTNTGWRPASPAS